jgi:hypothetical protein
VYAREVFLVDIAQSRKGRKYDKYELFVEASVPYTWIKRSGAAEFVCRRAIFENRTLAV